MPEDVRRKNNPCTCPEWKMEDGTIFNPWILGHRPRCPMFMAKCPDCGMSSGTHKERCPFWDSHPLLTPF